MASPIFHFRFPPRYFDNSSLAFREMALSSQCASIPVEQEPRRHEPRPIEQIEEGIMVAYGNGVHVNAMKPNNDDAH
jgi:hypothetical protein